MLCDDLAAQFKKAEENATQIIAVTHMIPFKELVRYSGTSGNDFVTAFLGSTQLSHVIKHSKALTHVIYGHTHTPSETTLAKISCIYSPIGYLQGQFRSKNEHSEFVSKRVKIVKI
jgi:hypothetical protein